MIEQFSWYHNCSINWTGYNGPSKVLKVSETVLKKTMDVAFKFHSRFDWPKNNKMWPEVYDEGTRLCDRHEPKVPYFGAFQSEFLSGLVNLCSIVCDATETDTRHNISIFFHLNDR